MTRRYRKATQRKVRSVMREYKAGTLHSGKSGRVVHKRKQAIAIALSEARSEGKKAPLARRTR